MIRYWRKPPKYRRWSKTAIECYRRGCNCSGCPVKDLFTEECRMKEAVLFLVSKNGAPTDLSEFYFPELTEQENNIVTAIINGAKTKEEIAEQLECGIGTIATYQAGICNFIETQGYQFKRRDTRFQEMVAYLQSLPKKEKKNTQIIDDTELTKERKRLCTIKI